MSDLPTQNPDLDALAERIRAGNPRAEEEFVRLFERRIRAFALVNLGEPQLAEELVQDVLWGVIRALREGRVQNPAQLPAFVFGTARNLVNDGVRSRAREKLRPLPVEEIPRPAAEQQAFERNHAAQQAIARLEPHERMVLMLSLEEGLDPEQIADRLGINSNAVRQRKARALRKLGEILRPQSQNGRPHLL